MKKPDKKKPTAKATKKKSVKKPVKKSVKKPIKKLVKKNPNSIQIFNILARKVFQVSKQKNLGWKWSDAQKFTSKNLFQKYKGFSKIPASKWANIGKEITDILEAPQGDFPRPKESCFNALSVPDESLEPINWWDFADVVDGFDSNLRIAVEFDGIVNTGIVKKRDLPDLVKIRETFREGNYGSNFLIVFRRLVAPNKKDDGEDCSYYILVTSEDSTQEQNTREGEVDVFTTKKSLPPKTLREIEEAAEKEAEKIRKREQEATERATRKKAKTRERPQQVEPKTEGEVKVVSESHQALTRALEILREDYKDGMLTLEEYKKRQQQILDKFEKGGII